MNQRMGRAAQDAFKLLCSRAGITCNPSLEDDYGWDFLLEVPMIAPPNSPADKLPGARLAFVQVKSTRGLRRRMMMKVSNALHLTKKPEPCFLVLFHEVEKDPRVYVRLFGETDMERTLRRARELSVQGRDAHKVKMAFGFSERDDHTDSLLDWILNSVRELGADYATEKSGLTESIGYSDRNWVANITLDGLHGPEDLVDLQLGLTEQLEVSHLAVFDERFGIKTPKPIVEESGKALIRMRPQEDIECVVSLKSQEDTVSMPSTARWATIPGPAPQKFKAAFHNELFVLVMSADGTTWREVDLRLRDVGDIQLPIGVLEQLAVLLSWHDVDVSIEITGDLPTLNFEVTLGRKPAPLNRSVQAALGTLARIAAQCQAVDITLSMNDVVTNFAELSFYHGVLGDAQITIEEHLADQSLDYEALHNLIGFIDVEVGDFTFLTVFDAAIETRIDKRGHLIVDLGHRNVRDCLVGMERETVRLQGQAAYEQYVSAYGDDWVGIGSLNVLVESSKRGG